MTPNRRIFLNIVATYGRLLYALVIGFFCCPRTLIAVGENDGGLTDGWGMPVSGCRLASPMIRDKAGECAAFTRLVTIPFLIDGNLW
jgi:hypothetical protein